jgi:hypothetical protein
MTRFIEILKSQTDEQIERGEPQEQIRVRVADDLEDPEILTLIDALRTQSEWAPEEAPARLHICRHDEVPPQPCELVPEDTLRAQE